MFVEATLGLGLVALLISFLPTIYQQFSRREVLVSQLDVRAGTPPTRRPVPAGQADRLDRRVGRLVAEWERWFTEVEESHTSYLSLPFFRSPHPGRSWITAAGAVLDSASLAPRRSTCRPSWQAQLCLRAGYLALRHIAEPYGIRFDPDPAPTDPISITRTSSTRSWPSSPDRRATRADRDQAWRDFAGWRVNYDTVLLPLSGLVMAPYSPWSSDRGINYRAWCVRTAWRHARPAKRLICRQVHADSPPFGSQNGHPGGDRTSRAGRGIVNADRASGPGPARMTDTIDPPTTIRPGPDRRSGHRRCCWARWSNSGPWPSWLASACRCRCSA